MREIQVHKFCDNHMPTEKVVATKSRVIAIDQQPPVELDMCDDCNTIFDGLAELMAKGSVLPDRRGRVRGAGKGPRKIDKDGACLEPGCDYESTDRKNLGQHMRREHGKGFRDYRELEKQAELAIRGVPTVGTSDAP